MGWVTLAEALSSLGHWRFPAASGHRAVSAARFNSFISVSRQISGNVLRFSPVFQTYTSGVPRITTGEFL